jgi:hypothetical protein
LNLQVISIKEEGRRKREEGRRKKEERRSKKEERKASLAFLLPKGFEAIA